MEFEERFLTLTVRVTNGKATLNKPAIGTFDDVKNGTPETWYSATAFGPETGFASVIGLPSLQRKDIVHKSVDSIRSIESLFQVTLADLNTFCEHKSSWC